MTPRKPKPRTPQSRPEPPLEVEGGLDPAKTPSAPDSVDGMLGEGGEDRGRNSGDGGMLGEG